MILVERERMRKRYGWLEKVSECEWEWESVNVCEWVSERGRGGVSFMPVPQITDNHKLFFYRS